MDPKALTEFQNKLVTSNLNGMKIVLRDGARLSGVPSHSDDHSFVLLTKERHPRSLSIAMSDVMSAEIEMDDGRVFKFQ